MKKFYILLLFLQFLFIGASAQSGWQYVSPTIPLPAAICNDTYFVNDLTGWVVGNKILKTTDGGSSWNIQLSPLTLNAISMINTQYGFVCGEQGSILLTLNGGTNWLEVNSSGISANFKDMCFLNGTTGFAVSDSGRIFKTTDGAVTWTTQKPEVNNYTGISFINSNTGFIFTKSSLHILKTTNCGVNWSFIPTPFNGSNKGCFINEMTGYAAGSLVWKTTDGGANWSISASAGIGGYNKVFFKNELTGFALANNGYFVITTDGGSYWATADISANSDSMMSISFSGSTGFLCSHQGAIYKTTAPPFSWRTLQTFVTRNDLTAVKFLNPQTGWTSGANGTLLKSTNGGINWFNITTQTTSKIYSFFFLNENTGWIGCNGSLLKKTTNGGNNWITETIDSQNGNIVKILFLNENTGYTADNRGKVFKTTNGGNNWLISFSSGNLVVNDMHFANTSTGWITGGYFISKTTDGGQNWFQQGNESYSNNSISFINELTGFVGSGNGLMKTTNGGNNWTYIESVSAFYIKFVNALTGWAENVRKTTDGGLTWKNQLTPVNASISSIDFINENTGWAVGTSGLILKTTNGGNVFVPQSSSSLPDKFYLHQNYPNPFNPNTVISFQLPINSFVSLKVYDINGREVSELVNEKLSAGEYKIDFNGASLPSGVYYYKMTTENFSETRKMILVK
ncbi:MAG: T9SS type A sorting domain-containing protein [Bacteroidetes bacterium]|nr:T9SS type A sorting domain-containing protein [Bacteroidota bacterium]